jgi:hypothetical protein
MQEQYGFYEILSFCTKDESCHPSVGNPICTKFLLQQSVVVGRREREDGGEESLMEIV